MTMVCTAGSLMAEFKHFPKRWYRNCGSNFGSSFVTINDVVTHGQRPAVGVEMTKRSAEVNVAVHDVGTGEVTCKRGFTGAGRSL